MVASFTNCLRWVSFLEIAVLADATRRAAHMLSSMSSRSSEKPKLTEGEEEI